jgi:long-chain-fatty-acid--CoA ligase ACSBG
MFTNSVRIGGTSDCMHVERDKKKLKWTWAQFFTESMQFAKSLAHLNVKEKSAVAIMGFNAPEWLFSTFGALMNNCVFTGIYITNGPDACFYQADHSDAEVICVETAAHLANFMVNKDKLTKVKAYVIWGEKEIPQEYKADNIYLWKDFLKLGEKVPDSLIEAKINKQKPGECCCLIYTSGTTGNPKGCMLSHDNLVWETLACQDEAIRTAPECAGTHNRIVSYLPLSHIAGFWGDVMVLLINTC